MKSVSESPSAAVPEGSFWRHVSVTSLGGLLSRVLGMLRDSATAALLGMSAGGVMDALITAFRIPDLFRRFLGEGVVTASFVPVLARRLEGERRAAWRLISSVLLGAAAIGIGLVLSAQAACLLGQRIAPPTLVWRLAMIIAPYLGCAWLLAPLAASLQTLGRFGPPALVTCLFNLTWLAAVAAAHHLSAPVDRAETVAWSIVLGGGLQVLWLGWALYRAGYRPLTPDAASTRAAWQILRNLAPAALGLAATQINIATDGLTAWAGASLTAEAWSTAVSWAPSFRSGAAAATYFGERLFSFPLGLVGVAVASVMFPRMSRHAARLRWKALDQDVASGLGLVLLLSLPAAVGLWVFAEPITRLLFQRGAFLPEDTVRAARLLRGYGVGVWAAAAIPLAARACYARGEMRTPAWSGAAAIGVHALAYPWTIAFGGEAGLACATSLACGAQLGLLLARLAVLSGGACLRDAPAVAGGSLLACGAMGLAAWPLQAMCLRLRGVQLAAALSAAVLACGLVYAATIWRLQLWKRIWPSQPPARSASE